MEKSARHQTVGTVLCRDFNLAPDASIDVKGPSTKKPRPANLAHFFHTNYLFDIWRCQHAMERDFTFFSKPHCTYSRIDLFVGDKQLLQDATETDIQPITWSDHAPVSLTLGDKPTHSSFTNWRNDPHLMAIPSNTTLIQNCLQEYFELNELSVSHPSTIWSAHKAYIRGTIIKLSYQAKRQRTQQLTELLDNITKLELINKTNPTPTISDKIFQARNYLRSFLNAKHAKLLLKLRTTFYEAGNKVGKLLANQIRQRRTKHRIPYIIHPTSGDKLYHQKDISNAFRAYYQALYNLTDDPATTQPTEANIKTFLDKLKLPKLSPEHLTSLNSPFTTTKIIQTISTLPSGKAPGPDGFSTEYYKMFGTTLAPHLCQLFNAAVSSGAFPAEMLSANIVTLPKPGKESVTPIQLSPHLFTEFRPQIIRKTYSPKTSSNYAPPHTSRPGRPYYG